MIFKNQVLDLDYLKLKPLKSRLPDDSLMSSSYVQFRQRARKCNRKVLHYKNLCLSQRRVGRDLGHLANVINL